MEGEDAVLDLEQELDTGAESGEQQESTSEAQESITETTETESPFSPKVSREFSNWLKELKAANPEAAKYVRMAKDAYSRQYALNQLDPKGIDGVRERYSVLDSVIHNDPERGELKGAEAVAAMQDHVREIAEIDEKIANGDSSALESFGDEMKAGIVKMAPAILDMARQMDPDGYNAAILPHFVQALAGSPLVQNYNAMVDVLNEQMPNWLPEDKKQAWADDKMKRIMGMAGNMGTWLNALAEKAGKPPQPRSADGKPPVDKQAQREKEFNEREQAQHWNTNISPKLDAHASTKFEELYRPYGKRLNLDNTTRQALKMEFSKRVSQTAAKDANYTAQIGRYRAQRNPDPGTVLNYAKVQFDKHAKTVMDSLVNERYKPFLTGKSKPPLTPQSSGGQNRTSPTTGIQFVGAKPSAGDIDYKNTSTDMIYKGQYRLKSGKVVQVRG